MSGVYGDLLAYFPEQFITVSYFEKEPLIGSGYKDVASGFTDIIIQPQKSFSIALGKNISQASSDVLAEKDKEYIWASDDTPLKVGMYIVDDKDMLCAITGKADFSHLGGFIRFDFEIVQGAQGGDRESASIIQGSF